MPDLYRSMYWYLIGSKSSLKWLNGRRYQTLPNGTEWEVRGITVDDKFLIKYGVFNE